MSAKTEPLFPWLDETRQRLYKLWVSKTGHHPSATANTWACEIAHKCRDCNEHLSIPCSLLREANEIGLFLSVSCFTETPWSFLRLYLLLLSEFAQQLNDLAGLLQVHAGKPPRLVCLWGNKWAKHRLNILVQHHPTIIFADEYQGSWTKAEAELPRAVYELKDGSKVPLLIIDTKWLGSAEAAKKTPNLTIANAACKAAVVVPPLDDFLQETINYFRRFIDAVVSNRDVVRQFESKYGCVQRKRARVKPAATSAASSQPDTST